MRAGVRRNMAIAIAAVFVVGMGVAVAHGTFIPHPPSSILYVSGSAGMTPPVTAAAHTAVASSTPAVPPVPVIRNYIEISNSCAWDWSGGCVQARTSPDASSSSALQLRNGMVLEVSTTTYRDSGGGMWYQVIFSEWVRYPDRFPQPLYVSNEYADVFSEPIDESPASTTKRIIVDRSDQKLYAYDGNELFMETTVSTGLDLTPTPRGNFTVYRKTPSRYMQGPLPGISDQYYDLPGVPWDLYFTPEGGAIHGAYWHNHFGEQWSHGCVNLPLDEAKKLYDWAPVGTPVTVRD